MPSCKYHLLLNKSTTLIKVLQHKIYFAVLLRHCNVLSRFNFPVLLVVLNCFTIMVQVKEITPISEERTVPNAFSSNIEANMTQFLSFFEPK